MFLALCCIFVVLVITYLILKWRYMNNFWLHRGIPYYPVHPILGSLTFLQRENPAVWMKKLYNDFKFPYVGIWIFWRPGLVVNCPELARRILVKDHDNFINRFLSSGKTDPVGALNLFTVNDPTWSFLRRRLTSMFTAARLKSLDNLINTKANDLVMRIQVEIKSNEDINLRSLLADYTSDVIGEAAFGLRSESVKTGDSALRNVTRDFMKYGLSRGLSWSSIFFFPELVDVFRFSMFPKHSTAFLQEVIHTVVAQRGGYTKQVKECRDLLDALVKIKQEAAFENKVLDENFLLAQATAFLQGGFDTTSNALNWAFYELAWNPHCQEKLYQEVLAAKMKIGNREFDYNDLADLTYLKCVLNEVLRKYPAMGWIDRIASKPYKIDDNLTIPAGTVIYVNANGMQYDPQYFPEPNDFNPDRFLPENERNIKPFTYLPFGEGPRICIGKRFADQTMRHALALLILNFKFLVLPNTPKPNDCHIEKHGLFLAPAEKLSVGIKYRR